MGYFSDDHLRMKPELKKYLDAHKYLQDFYNCRKHENPAFSYEIWAKELNATDKSYVRFMIMGKRNISEAMTKAFAENLQLNEGEKEYFGYLVQYTQSRTPEQRSLFGKKLIELLQIDFSQFEMGAQYQFLSNPLMPRLQVLLGLTDVDSRAENLSWILGCSADEVEQCLKALEEMKLIEKINSGYRSLNKNFKVPDTFSDIGLEAFYIQSLETLKKSIYQPKEERRFKSLFLPLNEYEFNQFLANLQAFTKEQLAYFNPNEYADRKLYQVHLNIGAVANKQKESNLEINPAEMI